MKRSGYASVIVHAVCKNRRFVIIRDKVKGKGAPAYAFQKA